MILRRFMKHVTEQNWFAVGLDVLVVITGIFLGMQVTEWNAERGDRIQEKSYLARLHEDVATGIISGQSAVQARDVTAQSLAEILNVFDGNGSISQLSGLHCYAVYSSHIYFVPTSSLPTLTELVSSGSLSLIQDAELRQKMTEYLIAEGGLNQLLTMISQSPLLLSQKYPQWIALDRNMRNPRQTKEFTHLCDFVEMKNDIAFNNDLIDNSARHNILMLSVIQHARKLNTIHTMLDVALGYQGH